MATVIAHFRNEARLLPYWLAHHHPLFDHGILIDHGSTDESVDVCKTLAPDWVVVPTKLANFDAIDNDFEVMTIETGVQGWKVALNITEFLYARDLRGYLQDAASRGVMAVRSRGVIMVDREPGKDLVPGVSLIDQKCFGYVEEGWRLWYAAKKRTRRQWRRRLIHRYPQGAYMPGRHGSFRHVDEQPEHLFVLWYGFSPWADWFVNRKVSFADRVSEEDRKSGRGTQHLLQREQLDEAQARLRRIAYDVRAAIGWNSSPRYAEERR